VVEQVDLVEEETEEEDHLVELLQEKQEILTQAVEVEQVVEMVEQEV
jgi:hypothetical protein